jgi:hypothetical protein
VGQSVEGVLGDQLLGLGGERLGLLVVVGGLGLGEESPHLGELGVLGARITARRGGQVGGVEQRCDGEQCRHPDRRGEPIRGAERERSLAEQRGQRGDVLLAGTAAHQLVQVGPAPAAARDGGGQPAEQLGQLFLEQEPRMRTDGALKRRRVAAYVGIVELATTAEPPHGAGELQLDHAVGHCRVPLRSDERVLRGNLPTSGSARSLPRLLTLLGRPALPVVDSHDTPSQRRRVRLRAATDSPTVAAQPNIQLQPLVLPQPSHT